MTDIEQKIDELRAQVRENLSERDSAYHSLGERLLSLPPESQESGLLEEQRSTAEEHKKRVPRFQETFTEIEESEKELKELKEAETALKNRKAAARETMESLQESLGEELFHQLKTQDSPEWESAYEPAKELVDKLRDNDSELFQLENQISKKNLFNNMVLKSKMSILKNRKKNLESSLQKLYGKCFSSALEQGAGKKGEAAAGSLLVPWFRAEEEWKVIAEEEEEMENRKRLIRDRLKELGEGKGPKKRKDALLKEIEREELSLKDALIKLGEGVCGNMDSSLAKDPEISRQVSKIDELTEAGIALNLEIEKWEARKDIGKLDRDREYMTQKIASLEEEIQARKQEIKVLKKEIIQVTTEIEKKQTFAGEPPEEEADT